MTAAEPDNRIEYNDPDNYLGADYAIGLVDELVIHNALVHFEMTSDASGYLMVQAPTRHAFVRFHARPTTRAERRQILARSGGRLRDHLAALLPKWLGGRSLWAVPWYRRPASAVRGWWQDYRAAGAVFCAVCEEDVHCGGPEVPPTCT